MMTENNSQHDPQDSHPSSDDLSDEQQLESAKIESLEAELNETVSKLNDTQDRLLRIAAEADNARKRFEKEKLETRLYSIQDFAKDMLPVIDAFDKAIASIESLQMDSDSESGKIISNIVDGVKLVAKTFEDSFKKHGIERLPGKGSAFNPMFHNAIAKVTDASVTQDTVIDEFMPGYKIGDRVLRTAMVRVASPD